MLDEDGEVLDYGSRGHMVNEARKVADTYVVLCHHRDGRISIVEKADRHGHPI